MAINGFGNNYQSTGFQGNNYGNNYNGYSNIAPVTTPVNPPPVSIAFVQGKVGASTFPIMSSNTTVYLFDVQDQTKFYVKSTDAFGMIMPLREFKYNEIIQPQVMPNIMPGELSATADNNTVKLNDSVITEEAFEDLKNQLAINKEEFDSIKEQLATISKMVQSSQQSYKQKKERIDNV